MKIILQEIVALAAQALDASTTLVAVPGRDGIDIEVEHGLDPRQREALRRLLGEVLSGPAGFPDGYVESPTLPAGMGFFVAQPIAGLEGDPVAALCVLDGRARETTDAHRDCLRRLAAVIAGVRNAWRGQYELAAARNSLSLRERQLKTITDNIPMVIGYANASLEFEFANRAMSQFVPGGGDVRGLRVASVLGSDAYAIAEPAIRRALAGEQVTFQGEIRVAGAVRHREVTYVPDFDEAGAVVGFYGLSYDVTERVRQADALRQREAHLSGVLETMTEGVVIHASDGRIVRANPSAADILGLTNDQLLGKTPMDPAWEAVTEDETPLTGDQHPAMISLRTGTAVRGFLMGVRSASGVLRWLNVNALPLFDSGPGTPSGALATFVDVTEQRALTRELERARADLRAVLDHVPVAICSWHADATNRFANRLAEVGFGVAPGGAPGKTLRELVGEERWERQRPHFEASLQGKRVRNEVLSTLHDGSQHYFQVEWVPEQRNGSSAGAYSVVTDVTELRTVYERIRELARLIDRAREGERRTIALALHEGIAQDLYGISLMLQQLQDPATEAGQFRENCVQLQVAIEQCMADVRAVANDLRPSELTHLSVGDALQQQATQFSALTGVNAEVRIAPELPAIDEARQLLLFRAAQEALTNVSKHARAVRVEVSLVSRSGSVELCVSDDGRGIRESELSKAGTFGLLTVRERCREIGATFRIGPGAQQRGTEFVVTLPIGAGG